ncbi:MAG: hypothetical protein PHU51_01660 [Candidatus Nanoarchaeia archaeon]|nr:hypothetical protein [Candidatus Nanoarchaeia archaeon]
MVEKNNIYLISIIAIVAIVGIVAMTTVMGKESSSLSSPYYSENSENVDMAGQAIKSISKVKPVPISTTKYVNYFVINEQLPIINVGEPDSEFTEISLWHDFLSGNDACNSTKLRCSKIQKLVDGNWINTNLPCDEEIFDHNQGEDCSYPLSDINDCISGAYLYELDKYYESFQVNLGEAVLLDNMELNFSSINVLSGLIVLKTLNVDSNESASAIVKESNIVLFENVNKKIFVDGIFLSNIGNNGSITGMAKLGWVENNFFTQFRAVCSATAVPELD